MLILFRNHRIKVGGTEVKASEWILETSPDTVDATTHEYVSGLREVRGSFHGSAEGNLDGLPSDEPVEIYLYGPVKLTWYRAWWIRARKQGWPDEVIAHGPAYPDLAIFTETGGRIRVVGSFYSSAPWTMPLFHDPTWGGYWERFRMRVFLWRHGR